MEWRAVLGYEGLYEASSEGEIRSLPKAWKSRYSYNVFPGRVLKRATKSTGYVVVSLSKNNKPIQVLVHRVILEAFAGPAPQGTEACHNNGIRADCRAENLRWDTRKANHADKIKHGTHQSGERHWTRLCKARTNQRRQSQSNATSNG